MTTIRVVTNMSKMIMIAKMIFWSRSPRILYSDKLEGGDCQGSGEESCLRWGFQISDRFLADLTWRDKMPKGKHWISSEVFPYILHNLFSPPKGSSVPPVFLKSGIKKKPWTFLLRGSSIENEMAMMVNDRWSWWAACDLSFNLGGGGQTEEQVSSLFI